MGDGVAESVGVDVDGGRDKVKNEGGDLCITPVHNAHAQHLVIPPEHNMGSRVRGNVCSRWTYLSLASLLCSIS